MSSPCAQASIRPYADASSVEIAAIRSESTSITPIITADSDKIRLHFEWELRQITGHEQRKGPDNKTHRFPLIAVDEIKTVVTVPDGKTLLIGGKKIRSQSSGRSKTPVLGDLPLIGGLFRSAYTIKDAKNTNFLIWFDI